MCFGGGSNTTVQQYTPPAAVSDAYNYLLSQGQSLAQNPYPAYTQQAAQNAQANIGNLVAPMSANQNAAIGGIQNLTGYMNPFIQGAAGLTAQGAQQITPTQFNAGNVNQYLSPYLQNVMGSTVANINETNAQQQQQLTGNTIAQGAFGGDRAAIAQSELARQQNLANNATLANIANTGYTSALGEFNNQQQTGIQAQQLNNAFSQQAGAQLANIGNLGQTANLAQLQALYGAGTAQQQQQQAGLSTAYQQFLNQNAYPYQQLSWLGGLDAGAASALGGTTTTTAPGPSGLSQLIGIGGMLGSLGGSGGVGGLFSSIGAGLGNIASALGPAALVAKDGGRITEERANHFASGGIADMSSTASPISGLTPAQFMPTGQSNIANIHQGGGGGGGGAQSQNSSNNLDDMVKNIRLMMGKDKSQQPDSGSAPAPKAPSTPTVDQSSASLASNQAEMPQAYSENKYGGVIHKDAGGSITLPYGLVTSKDLQEQAQSNLGAGVPESSSMEALADRGVLGSARGGVIKGYDEGGPANNNPPQFDPTVYAAKALPFLATRESSNNANAQSNSSSASGLYQFTDPTFQNVLASHPELPKDVTKNDPRVAMAYATDQAKVLNDNGIEPSPENIHTNWFLGPSGGTAFLKGMKDNPNAPATSFAGRDQVASNPSVFFNKDGSTRTVAEVYAHINGVGGGVAQPSTTPQQTQTPTTSDNIPYRSTSTKEGLFGALGISMTPEERLAAFTAFAKLAGTPGKFGQGLAAAADTYAKTLMAGQEQTRQTALAQAQGEQARSSAKLSSAEARQKGLMPVPGGFVQTGENPQGQLTLTNVDIPNAGQTVTVGGASPKAGEAPAGGATPPTGAPTAPTAPQTPSSIDMSLGPQLDSQKDSNSISKDQSLQRLGQEARKAGIGPQMADVQKQFGEIYGQTQKEQQAAYNNVGTIQQTTRALADLPNKGPLTPGAADQIRLNLANYINTIGKAAGIDIGATDKTLSSSQVLDKLRYIQSQGAQVGIGKEAGFWLDKLSNTYPNTALTKDASNEILSNMIVNNGIAMDRARAIDKYKTYSGYAGTNFNTAFDSINKPSDYSYERQAVQGLLGLDMQVGNRNENPVTMLQEHKMTPEQFDAIAKKLYGINNLSRHFGY